MQNNKHVLVEKPITTSFSEIVELVSLAKAKNRILLTDYTFLYTNAIKEINKIINSGNIGAVTFFDSTRINLGIFQSDINVLWDLATHDISILLHLIEERPISVQAFGIAHHKNDLENISYVNLRYNSNFIAHISCSWSSPVKIRKLIIGGENKMIIYNDLEPTEKVKIYNSTLNYITEEDKSNLLVDYRIGDLYIPKLDNKEALRTLIEEFVHSVSTNSYTLYPLEFNLEITKILAAADVSLKERSREVFINEML